MIKQDLIIEECLFSAVGTLKKLKISLSGLF